jgi:catecholate siderophore receptor
MLSHRLGFVWEPTEEQSYYFSYGTSFNPSAETFALSTATVDLDPEEDRSFEVGAKVDFFAGSLAATAAIFRLEKTNARTTDPDDPTRNILAGEQRTDGIELGVAGSITPKWKVSAAYAYLDATILKSNNVQNGRPIEGNSPQNVPRNSGVVWSTYNLTEAFEVGGGIFFSDHRFTDNAHTAKIPGYARFDAVVSYYHKYFDIQANLFNLFDKRYFESGQANSALPGVPFSGQITLRVKY